MNVVLAGLLLVLPWGAGAANQSGGSKALRVVRCTLNGLPRMAVLPLSEDMSVAFDCVECRLYMAWRGGVNFEGWPYDGRRGLSPTVQSTRLYFEASDDQVWTILRGGETMYPAVRFRGYTFGQVSVHFHFSLILPTGEEIKVFESLSTHSSEDGSEAVLQRRFEFSGMPENTKVQMPLRGNTPWDRYEVMGTGDGKVDRESAVMTQKRDGYNICGFAWRK